MKTDIESNPHPRNRDREALKLIRAFFGRRDLLWLALLLVVCAGWWSDHRRRDELSESRRKQAELMVKMWNSRLPGSPVYIVDGEAVVRWEKDRPLTKEEIDAINGY